MGLSASQGRMLLLTARKSDLEFRAQQISQKRLMLSQQLEEIAVDYEDATSNRQMKISLANVGVDSEKNAKSSVNLSYAALISGTLNNSQVAQQAGLQAYSRTEVGDYASNVFYRLTDGTGAIVISSTDEIPTTGTATTKSYADAQLINKNKSDLANIYKTTNKTISSGNTTTEDRYVVKAATDSDLAKVLGSKEAMSVEVDTEKGIVVVTSSDNTQTKTYYSAKTGKKITDTTKTEDLNDLKSATLTKDISKYKSTTTNTDSVKYSVKQGSDGVYTLSDSSGTVINRYLVDPSLKYGATDSSGSTSGPNYLQDCIRNGKYLIQKGRFDTDGEDSSKVVWNYVSWDATTNISDSYYAEDDDAAKAKYDRLQNQVQAEDKKLELELNNIETQRNAVNTETDSVKKVMSDNVEKTFKTFA